MGVRPDSVGPCHGDYVSRPALKGRGQSKFIHVGDAFFVASTPMNISFVGTDHGTTARHRGRHFLNPRSVSISSGGAMRLGVQDARGRMDVVAVAVVAVSADGGGDGGDGAC